LSDKVYRDFLKYYVDSSVHVALALCCLYMLSAHLMNLLMDFKWITFLFFSSVSYYNIVKFGGLLLKTKNKSTSFLVFVRILTKISLLVSLVLFCFFNFELQIFISAHGLLSMAYALPVLSSKPQLRNHGFLKVFIVAFIWTSFTFLAPILLENGLEFIDMNNAYRDWILLYSQRFILVVILMIPFELRDVREDQLYSRTIPQYFGVTNTKWLSALLAMLWLILTFVRERYVFVEVGSRFIIWLILLLIIGLSSTKQRPYFASFWVEAVPMLFWLILICGILVL